MAVAMAVEVLVVGLVAVEMAAELTVGVAMGEEAAAGLGVEVGIAANRKAVRVERRAEGARVAVVMAVATVEATWAVEAKGGEKAAAVPGRAAGAVLLVAPSAAGQVMVGKLVKAVWGRWRRRRRWRRTGRRRRARRWRQRAWWWWWRFG